MPKALLFGTGAGQRPARAPVLCVGFLDRGETSIREVLNAEVLLLDPSLVLFEAPDHLHSSQGLLLGQLPSVTLLSDHVTGGTACGHSRVSPL